MFLVRVGRAASCRVVGVSRGVLGVTVRFLTGVNMSKTRAPPSGANPSNLVDKRIDTEDDVLHIQVGDRSVGWPLLYLQCGLGLRVSFQFCLAFFFRKLVEKRMNTEDDVLHI